MHAAADANSPGLAGAQAGLAEAAAGIWPSTAQLISEDVLIEIGNQAAKADETGVLSTSTLDRLRHSGYFGLAIPSQLSGGGAGLLKCAAVQRRLGMADPALAIAANMHLSSIGMAVEHWQRHRDTCGLLLQAIAMQKRIVASAFAEPGLGGALLRSNAKARRTTGGYLVTGVKSPCSLAAHCDLVCFQMEAEALEPKALMIGVIPLTQGVRVERTWNSLGMRASASDTLVLENCFVPDELIFHRCEPGVDNDEVFAAGIVWFCVTVTATYFGIVKTALETCCAALRRSSVSHIGSPRADLPSVQAELGELVAGTLAVEVACAAIADRLDAGKDDPRALAPFAVAIKHTAVDACIRAVERSAELVGGISYARKATFERLWRDVQAARFHPPTRLTARQILGRWALGRPFSFEVDERPSNADSSADGSL